MKQRTVIIAALAIAFVAGIVMSKPQQSADVAQSSKEVVQSAIVDLKDGDHYALKAAYVSQTIAGKKQVMLAYNGMIPGPTIRVAQGATVTIDFTNDTDIPALLHSHGVRLDNAYDGAQTVQKEMTPGERFSYKITFPDAGVFWYHPHVSEVYEQSHGLYGAFVVTPADPAYFPPVNAEVPLFISDLPVNASGDITITKDSTDHALMGHYGNVMFVNGQEKYSMSANAGDVIRFYMVNAANARPFKVSIPGAKLKVVGGDNGAYEKAFFAESAVIAPSERVIVDAYFEKPGDYEIQNAVPKRTYSLGFVHVGGAPAGTSYAAEFQTLQSSAATSKSIDPFRNYFATTPDKKLVLGVSMGQGAMGPNMMGGGHVMPDGTTMQGAMGPMMSGSTDGIEWEDAMPMMGTMTTDAVKWTITDAATGKSNMDIDWVLEKGKPIKIEIYNDPKSMHPMQHPIHFHGQRFLVVSRNGVKQTDLVWKDTTLVKIGETVDIVLDPSNPGIWMAHCHIAEHLQDGMMFVYSVK